MGGRKRARTQRLLGIAQIIVHIVSLLFCSSCTHLIPSLAVSERTRRKDLQRYTLQRRQRCVMEIWWKCVGAR